MKYGLILFCSLMFVNSSYALDDRGDPLLDIEMFEQAMVGDDGIPVEVKISCKVGADSAAARGRAIMKTASKINAGICDKVCGGSGYAVDKDATTGELYPKIIQTVNGDGKLVTTVKCVCSDAKKIDNEAKEVEC